MAPMLGGCRVNGHHPFRTRNGHPSRREDRSVLGNNLTIRRACALIALVTLVVGIASGLLMRVFDPKDFDTAGSGLWWAVQTITTVGYGDKVPTTTEGKLVAVLVMATGLGFMSVITAAITATFVESARRRRGRDDMTLHHIAQRLDQIEALVNQRLEADQRDRDQADSEGLQQGRDLRGPA
jgi:voltage-gated potassium channel